MTKKIKSQKLHQQENSQNYESSQNCIMDTEQGAIDANLQNISQSQLDNTNIPFFQYRKSFTIFNKTARSKQFKSYAKFKSDAAFDYFKTVFTQVSGLSFEQIYEQQINQKIKQNDPPPMFQENIFLCQIPQSTTFFVHIYLANDNKTQIRVMNSSGYVYAYFVEIRPCRKFSKIYKILRTINPIGQKNKSKHLFIIYDQIGCPQNQLNFIKKIADFTSQFCYYFYTNSNLQSQEKISLDSQRKGATSKQSKGNLLQTDNLFCYYSNIFKCNVQNPEENIKKIIKVQDQIQNKSQFAFNSSEGSVYFILKSVLTNYQKFFKFSDKNQMYSSFKKMIDDFEQTLQKKNQIVYGDPEDHYPQKMEACKQCVHCPFNKKMINKFLIEKQKSSSVNNFCYDNAKDQVKSRTKNQKKKSQKPNDNKKSSKIVLHFKLSDDEQDQNCKVHKSKYRCEGCTATAKKDVPLCLQCFADYHIKKDKLKEKNMKKMTNRALRKKKLQALKYSNALLQDQKNNRTLQIKDINDGVGYQTTPSQEIYDQPLSSQIEDPKYDFTVEQLSQAMQVLEIDKINQLLEEINVQRSNFMKAFREMYSDPTTRNIALSIVEFVQLNLVQLNFWEIDSAKR